RLPIETPAWQRLWTRTPVPAAYLYVAVVTRGETAGASLALSFDGQPLGELADQSRIAPADQTEASGEGSQETWHRLAVPRQLLQGQTAHEVVVEPVALPSG